MMVAVDIIKVNGIEDNAGNFGSLCANRENYEHGILQVLKPNIDPITTIYTLPGWSPALSDKKPSSAILWPMP